MPAPEIIIFLEERTGGDWGELELGLDISAMEWGKPHQKGYYENEWHFWGVSW